jgi:deazaflavin-dependent oxidoreductase (nitroreductase family)
MSEGRSLDGSVASAGPVHVPGIVATLNPLIDRLLRLGLPFGPNVLLTVRGRSTGRAYRFPVAIVHARGRRFVQSPFGEVQWVRNLRASGEAVVTHGRRREEVLAVELAPEEAGAVLREGVAPYLRFAPLRSVLGRFIDLRADASTEELVAEARRHPTFELLPRSSSAGSAVVHTVPRGR